MSLSAVPAAIRDQAAFCARSGSPFAAGFLQAAADHPAAADLLSPWAEATPVELVDAAVPLRLLAAFHDLALNGEPALAAAFPSDERPGDPVAAWAAAARLEPARRDDLAAFLAHEPQTNEVGRSAALLPGFLEIARSGLPLRLFELGASAGLNQLWDRLRCETDDWAWGPPDSPVVLRPVWTGPPPPRIEAAVVSRAACDRRPVDLSDPAARRRLSAYVWADQRDRLARLQAAIGLALASGVRVDAEDALAWTRRRVGAAARAATVLYHSVFLQYLTPPSRRDLAEVIADLGGRAAADAPFAWLRLEPAAEPLSGHEVRLTLWPGGEDRRLAVAHPHGAWVESTGQLQHSTIANA